MPELTIPVGQSIGPDYIDWETWDYVPGFTVDTIRRYLRDAEYNGVEVTGILLQFGICYGGLTSHAMEIHNYLRGSGLPVRAHVLSMTASAGTIVALAADEVTLEHTAQWMVHRPLYPEGTFSQRSEDLRADADRIDRDEQSMIDIYAARTGKSEDEIRELIKVDRFMSAAEAQAFGFVDKVNPLRGKAPAATQVQARLKTFRQAVARADKNAVQLRASKPQPKPNASTKPARPASTPRPMAKTPAKPAAKPAASNRSSLTAAQKSAAQAVAALAKSLGVKATIEGVDADTAPAAVAVATAVTDGSLYTDGALAVDSAVFYDEALTEPADDGDYDAEDGRVITVAGGICTTITDAPAAEGEEADTAGTEAITAAVSAALAPLTARLDTLEATFKSTVPPTPRPREAAAQGGDGKAKPKAKAAHHSTM
jgi:ClpP class serine protease